MFAEPGEPALVVTEKGHGRLERRAARVSSLLAGYSDFPGLRQVIEVRKKVVRLKSGQINESVQYAITSLTAEQAGPARLLALLRGHWSIENQAFHVKDDSFGEDRQVLQTRHGGWVLSLLRGVGTDLLRGQCSLWRGAEPLTGRAQRVNACPLALLTSPHRL